MILPDKLDDFNAIMEQSIERRISVPPFSDDCGMMDNA